MRRLAIRRRFMTLQAESFLVGKRPLAIVTDNRARKVKLLIGILVQRQRRLQRRPHQRHQPQARATTELPQQEQLETLEEQALGEE